MKDNYSDYYKFVSSQYNSLRIDQDKEIELTIQIINQNIGNLTGTILDLGCGTGRYSILLSTYGHEVVGLDLSFHQLTQAPIYLPKINGNVVSLPISSEEIACCFFVLMLHQLSEESIRLALEETHRVLKSGGKCIIKTCSHEDLGKRPFLNCFPSEHNINTKRYPDIPIIEAILKDAGFYIDNIISTFTESTIPTSTFLNSVRNKYNTTLHLLPDDEFQKGLASLEAFLENVPTLLYPHWHSIVIATK